MPVNVWGQLIDISSGPRQVVRTFFSGSKDLRRNQRAGLACPHIFSTEHDPPNIGICLCLHVHRIYHQHQQFDRSAGSVAEVCFVPRFHSLTPSLRWIPGRPHRSPHRARRTIYPGRPGVRRRSIRRPLLRKSMKTGLLRSDRQLI